MQYIFRSIGTQLSDNCEEKFGIILINLLSFTFLDPKVNNLDITHGCPLGNQNDILDNPIGCKHSKVDQESAPVYESNDFLGQTPISSSKMLFNIYIFHDDLYSRGVQCTIHVRVYMSAQEGV